MILGRLALSGICRSFLGSFCCFVELLSLIFGSLGLSLGLVFDVLGLLFNLFNLLLFLLDLFLFLRLFLVLSFLALGLLLG